MTDWLLRLCIHKEPGTAAYRAAVGSFAGLMGIACNLILCLGKLIVGALAGAVSITADALNNLTDATGSIVTLIGFRAADKPADTEHPFGHARAEYLSALGVAALILFIGFELGKSSVEKILQPEAVQFSFVTLVVLVGSIAVKLWLSLFNRTLSRRIDSATLAATAADSRNDCIATAAVLVSMLLEGKFGLPADGWVGLAVALFIVISGFNLARETVSTLLGVNVDPELRDKIVDFIEAQEAVLGYHDLMVHDYGPGHRFASLHVEMDYRRDVMECHELIDEMERECLRSHSVQLVIHYDPIVTDDPQVNALREGVKAALKAYDDRLSLHDFRVVPGKRHINLVFDVALPDDLVGKPQAVTRAVEQAMNSDPERQYHIVITFDSAAFN